MKRIIPRKKTIIPIAKLRNECDKLLQQKGRLKYNDCEICNKPMNCLHHFFPKSMSSKLRYDWNNLIPICNGCHMRHHSAGDPSIHMTIVEKRGYSWYEKLDMVRHKTIKVNIKYYIDKIKELN